MLALASFNRMTSCSSIRNSSVFDFELSKQQKLVPEYLEQSISELHVQFGARAQLKLECCTKLVFQTTFNLESGGKASFSQFWTVSRKLNENSN